MVELWELRWTFHFLPVCLLVRFPPPRASVVPSPSPFNPKQEMIWGGQAASRAETWKEELQQALPRPPQLGLAPAATVAPPSVAPRVPRMRKRGPALTLLPLCCSGAAARRRWRLQQWLSVLVQVNQQTLAALLPCPPPPDEQEGGGSSDP